MKPGEWPIFAIRVACVTLTTPITLNSRKLCSSVGLAATDDIGIDGRSNTIFSFPDIHGEEFHNARGSRALLEISMLCAHLENGECTIRFAWRISTETPTPEQVLVTNRAGVASVITPEAALADLMKKYKVSPPTLGSFSLDWYAHPTSADSTLPRWLCQAQSL